MGDQSFNWGLKLIFIVLAFHVALAVVQLDDIAEFCPGNFITQDYNASWENTRDVDPNEPYHVLFTNKFNLFAMTQYLYQSHDFKLLTEAQLENSCLTLTKVNGWEHVNATAYDKSLPIRLHPTENPKVFRFFLPMPYGGGFTGTASIALSDNESYNVFDYCYDNGLRAFAVLATTPFLDETALAVIKAHVKSLGFKERNFVSPSFLNCFDTKGNLAPSTEDLPIPSPLNSPANRSPIKYYSYDLSYPVYFYKKK